MNHYEKEKDEFEESFRDYKNKRIILYGIGRFTATLIPLLDNWNIVGLMDRDPNKIGTFAYGLPIIGADEAEKKADIVIINTAASYWDLIYQRIKGISIPVYFRNGERAQDILFQKEIEYWVSSFEQLKTLIDSYDVISFDFFDTLFSRKVYMASEIWEYVGDACKSEFIRKQFLQLRRSVYAIIDKQVPSIRDIYKKIALSLPLSDTNELEEKEIELEKKFLEPRQKIVSLIKYAINKEKEVYIMSDMYLPENFFKQKLEEYDIHVPKTNIFISHVWGYTKASGELWQLFQKENVKNRKALHIGDNIKSDIESCKKYSNVNPYYVMSKNEMMRQSSIRNCLKYAESDYHYMILGLCMERLFNDPFALCETHGKVQIKSRKDFGYVVLGPIVFSFLCWLMKSIKEDSVEHLCFLGRDGFFLKQDFEYFDQLIKRGSQTSTSYLEVSRQILMCAAIENESDFTEYIRMPYQGKVGEFFEDRLGIDLTDKDRKKYADMDISLPQGYEEIKESILHYNEIIKTTIRETRDNYCVYLKKMNLGKNTAVVDLGFYGTTQHYLSKLLKKEFIGYYISANVSDNNILSKKHVLKSCTNITSDKSCANSYIHNMGLALESFLTSPHGMVRSIDRKGRFINAPDTNNQIFFRDKVEINDGIRLFINDITELHYERLSKIDICIDDFVDNWYGEILRNCDFSEEVKRSFYNDNAFIHRRQERIFSN